MPEDAVKLQGIVPDHLKVRQSSILLDSLEVMTDIGFHEFEVGVPQRLLITVELWLEDLNPPDDAAFHRVGDEQHDLTVLHDARARLLDRDRVAELSAERCHRARIAFACEPDGHRVGPRDCIW